MCDNIFCIKNVLLTVNNGSNNDKFRFLCHVFKKAFKFITALPKPK